MNFCAELSAARGDSMIGTAPPQSRVLLVHQPGPWGPSGLLESRCDPQVARRFDVAAANGGMRLQTIRRPGKHEVGIPAGGFHVAIADTLAGTITWWSSDDLGEIVGEFEAGVPQRAPVLVERAPIYLVCAHGRHDPCCALRGRPVAEALAAARPGRVWETTHLGGDRFAANLLVLPGGELYGRVPASLAPDFATTIEAGGVVPTFLRGRIGLQPFAQAALVFAHESLRAIDRDALRVRSVSKMTDDLARVEIEKASGECVVVTVAAHTAAAAKLTCNGAKRGRAREYRGVEIHSLP